MALVLKDRVKETTTTTGTGTLTLAGAASGFQSFSVIGNGNTTYYAIVHSSANTWEVGIGTYTSSGTTLARTTVLASSNSGSAVNFGSGSKDVFVTYPASAASVLYVEKDSSTGSASMPVGTTAQRPATPAAGMFRMNTTTGNPEWYDSASSAWVNFADPLTYSVQYLVVAGGASGGAGSGGYGCGGGGGAGGYLTSTVSLLPGTPYTITIGAGGAATAGPGSTAPASPGTAGGNSVFGAFATAIGGGYGGAATNTSTSGGAGGAGGGAGGNASANGSGGSGTAGQGYGGSVPTAAYGSGGGGGASAAATSTINGAAGLNWLSLGTYYAGGGGGGINSSTGGSGGTGGGGAGGASGGAGSAGTANTGGGGGGGNNLGTGANSGAGGSGVVIIRYAGAQRGSGGSITSSGGYTYHTFTSSSTYTA